MCNLRAEQLFIGSHLFAKGVVMAGDFGFISPKKRSPTPERLQVRSSARLKQAPSSRFCAQAPFAILQEKTLISASKWLDFHRWLSLSPKKSHASFDLLSSVPAVVRKQSNRELSSSSHPATTITRHPSSSSRNEPVFIVNSTLS